jgi:hypothetical protein
VSSTKKDVDRSLRFKPNVHSEENKEARSFKDSHRRQQCRENLVLKKRELAEQHQEASGAAHEESQQEATTGAPIIPPVAASSSNSAAEDADLNNRIEEIFEEFEHMDEDSN